MKTLINPKIWSFLVLAAASTFGCNGSQQLATPMPEPPTLHFKILEPDPGSSRPDRDVEIVGTPDYAQPGALVVVTNLDTTAPAVLALVRDDGSFSLIVPTLSDDELRFEIRADDTTLELDDYLVPDDGGELLTTKRNACLEVNPGFELVFGDETTKTLEFVNRCDEVVTIESASFRTDAGGYVVVTPLPSTLAPDASSTIQVDIQSGEEEILFLELGFGDGSARYPFTLR